MRVVKDLALIQMLRELERYLWERQLLTWTHFTRKMLKIFLIADSQICTMITVEKTTTLQIQDIDKLQSPDNKETVILFLYPFFYIFFYKS